MYYSNSKKCVFFGAAVALIFGWATSACAQEEGGASTQLRTAANEAKFRVISRFPDEKASPSSARHLLFGGQGQFVDGAIREAIATQKWSVASMLAAKKKGDPAHTFLAGYLAHRAGDHAAALKRLEAVAGKVGLLEDYRLYFAAESALELDKFHLAALRAAKVPRDSLILGKSLIVLADALLAAGQPSDVERAVRTLQLYLKKFPNGDAAEPARLSLAQALERTERFDAAARQYLDILHQYAVTDTAKKARERLEAIAPRLSEELRARVENPPLELRMSRYRALFANHRSRTVINEVEADGEALDDSHKKRCEALYLVAKSHTKLREHSDGAAWYQRILDECEETSYVLKALYLGGKGYWNAGKRNKARNWFERIWTDFSDHSFADDAMYFVARILREQKKPATARKLLERQVQRYPGGDMAKDARWLLVREMFSDGDHKGVVTYVDGLEDTGEDDVYTRGRLHYFRARALEERGQVDRARQGFQKVAIDHPLSYYAFLGLNRLAELAEQNRRGARSKKTGVCAAQGSKLCDFLEPRRSPDIEVADRLQQSEQFRKGAELLRLGLTHLAEGEFQALRRAHSHPQNLWALSFLLDAAGAHRISHDLPRRHIDGWKTHYPTGGDDPRWSLAYPRPFHRLVQKWASKRNHPEALVYAIMREESGFNPRIESWANARGLLQLMEKTAANIAKKDGLSEFSAERLFEPTTNIRLGTAYLDELAGDLQDHPTLIIAGYNAGHTNVSRWLKKRGDLPLDMWVEDIPYGQTRKYAKRVLTSFWTYSWLYGDERVPRIDFSVKSKK